MDEWFKLGLIKTFLVIMVILINKYGNIKLNYSFPIAANILSALFLIIYSIKYLKLDDFKELNSYIILIVAISISITTLITYKIIKITPNPAYIRIFSAIDMIVILLISYIFFKEKITYTMIVGFVFISFGVMILAY
tara:strand:- start:4115 stop:4525 length:411 start_codon:yes stop_codon:yes gene_type:complete